MPARDDPPPTVTKTSPPSAAADAPLSITIDRARRVVRLGERRVVLGGRAFDLLATLCSRPGDFFSAEDLLAAVWPGRQVEPGNLRMQVNLLRRQLGAQAVVNEPGRGYRFDGQVHEPSAVARLRLVGRDAELQALDALMRAHRLVTVAGAGGIGKTSLARAWSLEQPVSPSRSAAWADLAAITEPALLMPVLAGALGLSPAPAGAMWTAGSVARALPERDWVLVLDNAEHLQQAVATLARQWWLQAPRLQLLVTSQVPLHLPHEHVLRLGPLACPEPGMSPAAAMALGAVALFVERARAAAPGFELDADTMPAVVELCQRLDGVPLALELAAARVPALGVHALARALDARLHLLGRVDGHAPQRQRTLRAALEWTHGLLEPAAQSAFAQLAVFAGPCTLDAARAVVELPGQDDDDAQPGPADWRVAHSLAALVDASLVTARPMPDGLQYSLQETARLFALQLLQTQGDEAAVRRRHFAWCQQWSESATPEQLQAGQAQLRAALDWALDGGDMPAGAALAERLAAHPALARLPADDGSQPAEATLTRLLQRLQDEGVIRGAASVELAPDTLLSMARRFRPDELLHFDSAVRELQRAVVLARQALDTGPNDGGHDAYLGQVLADVAGHTRNGQFEQGTERIDEALADLEQREARQRAALLHTRRALLESGVQQDRLRRDAHAVARRTAALLALDHPQRPTHSDAWLQREQQALRESLAESASLSLDVFIEMTRLRLAAAQTASERQSARQQLAQGLALHGERDSTSQTLDEAVSVCRAALAEPTPGQTDDEHAALLQVLAEALCLLGTRGRGTAVLEESVQCAEAALHLRPRERAPQDWAATQHHLGVALCHLGMREAGTARLQEAEHALRLALQEFPADSRPLERARTLTSLATVLGVWSSRELSVARREDCVAQRRAALALLDRARAPLLWSSVQCNLGIDLLSLGRLSEPERHWPQAVQAMRAALAELTRESAPLAWAKNQHNLGMALRKLGELQNSLALLEEACQALLAAQLGFRREDQPYLWASGRHDLGNARIHQGLLMPWPAGRSFIEEGLQALREALQVHTQADHLDFHVRSLCDLCRGQWQLGRLAADAALIQAALRTGEHGLDLAESGGLEAQADEIRRLLAQVRQGLQSASV